MKVLKIFSTLPLIFLCGENMARIIETQNNGRRIIKMSTDDIISIVKDYQRIVPRFSTEKEARDYLSDKVVFIPEDV